MSEPFFAPYKSCPFCGDDCHLKDMEKGGSCYGTVLPDDSGADEDCFIDDDGASRVCRHSCGNPAHQDS